MRSGWPVPLLQSMRTSRGDQTLVDRQDEHLPTDARNRSWPAALTCCAIDEHGHGRAFRASLAYAIHAMLLPWAQRERSKGSPRHLSPRRNWLPVTLSARQPGWHFATQPLWRPCNCLSSNQLRKWAVEPGEHRVFWASALPHKVSPHHLYPPRSCVAVTALARRPG